MLFDDLDKDIKVTTFVIGYSERKREGGGKKYLKIKIMEKPNNTQIKKKLHVKKRVKI